MVKPIAFSIIVVNPASVAMSTSYTSPAEPADHVSTLGVATPILASAGIISVGVDGVAADIVTSTSNVFIPVVLFATMVMLCVPIAAEPVLDTVNVVGFPGVIGVVPKVPVAPAGTPEEVNVTGSA